MKQRLTVNTLALGNLKKRKKQYTSLILGIILAMVFSSSVLLMVSSMVERVVLAMEAICIKPSASEGSTRLRMP